MDSELDPGQNYSAECSEMGLISYSMSGQMFCRLIIADLKLNQSGGLPSGLQSGGLSSGLRSGVLVSSCFLSSREGEPASRGP